MKTRLLFTLLLTVFAVLFTDAFSNINLGKSRDKEEEIILMGSLETGKVKSLFIPVPFEVWKSSTSIDVIYLSNLSNINVEVKNSSGQSVYSNNVNPVNGGHLLIDILGWEAGNYTITFSDSLGGCVYGAFTIY